MRARPGAQGNTAGPTAEREGFEPSNEVNPRYTISSRARSTAPAPLQMTCGAPQGSEVYRLGTGSTESIIQALKKRTRWMIWGRWVSPKRETTLAQAPLASEPLDSIRTLTGLLRL